MNQRVLFVSKAVAPPFRDGSSCLVRDLACALDSAHPTVLSTRDAPELAPHVRMDRIYRGRSRYAPALVDNLRVLHHLLTDFHHDLWHFVFAPNPASSTVGRALRTLRRKPIVQTVASRPLRFEGVDRLLFGDHVVAVSRHTADALLKHGASPTRVVVIPPPVHDITRQQDARRVARENAGIAPDVPLFVYAGDLEFSQGSSWIAQAAPAIARALPDAVIAFACRAKTPRAQEHRDRIAKELEPLGSQVRFLGEIDDLPALLASATAAPFPVDDLYGKVDIPYVVLESALLEVPMVVIEGGPLAEIPDAPTMAEGDVEFLAAWCIEMARDEGARRQLGARLRQSVRARHDPAVVAGQVQSLYDALIK
jgi:glycosyltransferase involved in cell wall biosynthesis